MQRLVQSFINLYCAGNMLFRAWKAEVYCSPRHGVSLRMDFCLTLINQLKGTGPVVELLEAVSRQMEDFLDHWISFVAEKRAKHFYLNYYTAEQLVYLSSRQCPSRGVLQGEDSSGRSKGLELVFGPRTLAAQWLEEVRRT